jgi:hypothetical protein
LRGYINSPAVSRKEVIAAIQWLNEPQPGVYIKALRKAYEAFSTNGQIDELLTVVKSIGTAEVAPDESKAGSSESKSPVRREDLKLVCFDYVWQ